MGNLESVAPVADSNGASMLADLGRQVLSKLALSAPVPPHDSPRLASSDFRRRHGCDPRIREAAAWFLPMRGNALSRSFLAAFDRQDALTDCVESGIIPPLLFWTIGRLAKRVPGKPRLLA